MQVQAYCITLQNTFLRDNMQNTHKYYSESVSCYIVCSRRYNPYSKRPFRPTVYSYVNHIVEETYFKKINFSLQTCSCHSQCSTANRLAVITELMALNSTAAPFSRPRVTAAAAAGENIQEWRNQGCAAPCCVMCANT